jgi:type II secretory ATPase GspE/PulE/Tfp pilus assembly ATPase PilB-like protein
LVLSTLHTNSAAESLMRLEDMQVPPYLIANALLMIVAQRLVRRACKMCCKAYTPTDEDREEFKLSPERLEGATLVTATGCEACYETGYLGRVAVYEALGITNHLRALIRRGAAVDEIIEAAEANGMQVLFDAGIERALRGETTLAEVRRCLIDAR